MSAPPSIPPRPSRSQNNPAPAGQLDTPKVPPRPSRGLNRSVSPGGDRNAPSPFNDPTYRHGPPPEKGSRLSVELPARPPSVSLPSLGEEGNEYASFEDLSKTLTNESQPHGSPQHTTAIAGDLPLHAPKASVPASTAKSRIQTVTRTDSSQAEAAGFGKQLAPEDKSGPASKSGRSGSSMGSRPSSIFNDKDEHGIPEIGVQVPMFRGAGDVQAPSPAPFAQQSGGGAPGIFNKPGGRHHGRTKSGREIFTGPPGSYGLHGHGKISQDAFEQKWYEKHPDDLKREKAGEYGPHIQENRKDYHWASGNLDQLVHTPSGVGFGKYNIDAGRRNQRLTERKGTSREAVSTPDEQIGYLASEQYASRYTSPRPQSSGRPASIKSGVHVDSPLRQETDSQNQGQFDGDGGIIHIDPPAHRRSKVHGGGAEAPTEDLGPQGGNTQEEGGWITERGYGAPILASDEVKKHPDAEWRQPAISPEMERRGDEYTVNEDGTPAYITKVRTHSRSSSRDNARIQRTVPSPSHFNERGGTPLESFKEYEPLFPEDEEDGKKPKTQVEKLKRPSVARHHFPSQDVWEDTPESFHLQTTVETPEVPDEPESVTIDAPASKAFEKPEEEEARKENITKEDQQSFLPEHTRRFAAENKLLGKVRGDDGPQRPGVQRFPSQDVWEDAPDYGRLETTVSTPQTEDTNEYADDSPVVDKPIVPARPNISARPQKQESPVDKKAPSIPDRPKPQIPARPKPATTARGEDAGAEAQAAAEHDSVQAKAKPPVPARPGGSKIAALQAGFLKDLNSKLGLGPQAPKKEPEPEQEAEPAAPLQDARKGRAKGPQRRKPAASPTPAATVTAEVAVAQQNLAIAPVTHVWSFGEDGALHTPAAALASRLQSKLSAPSKSQEPSVLPDAHEKEIVVDTEDAPLTKTTTAGSTLSGLSKSSTREEEPSELSKTLTQGSDIVSKTLSQGTEQLHKVATAASETASSLAGPNQPLATDHVAGSVDAPGAFPGMEHEEPVSVKEPAHIADSPVATSKDAVEAELEKKYVEAPSTASYAPPNEGAGSTQSFAG